MRLKNLYFMSMNSVLGKAKEVRSGNFIVNTTTVLVPLHLKFLCLVRNVRVLGKAYESNIYSNGNGNGNEWMDG